MSSFPDLYTLTESLKHCRLTFEFLRITWPCTCIEICTVLDHQKCIICIELLSVVLKATKRHCHRDHRHRDHRHPHQLCTC